MTQGVIVLDDAEDELIEAQNWYDRQRPGLGNEFRMAIQEAIERLIKAPLAASPIVNLPHPLMLGGSWSNGLRIRLSSLSTKMTLGYCICSST